MPLRDSWLLFALGSACFAALTAIFGKLGVARVDNSLSGTGLSTGVTGENKTGVYASVGAQYAINEKVSLTAEVEHFGKSADQGHKATGLALGARYNF